MSKFLILCTVVSVLLATADAVRMKIPLPRDDQFHREYQAHRMKRQAQTSCDDFVELSRENVTLVGRLNELNDRVRFYRSQHARENLEFLETRIVPGLGGQTVRDVLDALQAGECYTFFIGGGVRDQFLGRTPRDVDVEIDCELQDIIDICVRTWGQHNCRNSPGSIVGHIGNSSIPGPGQGEDDIDYAPTIAVFYVPLSSLEYTVNMMAYDTNGNDFIADIAGTGRIDACNRHVRIPSDDDSVESWDAWRIDSDGDTDFKLLYRAWKLREKSFEFFNEATQDYIVRFAQEGIEKEPAKFYDFYCDEVFDSDYDKEENACLVAEETCEGGFENKFDYDRAYAEDFSDFWTDTIESNLPSNEPCDLCQLPSDTGPCRAAIPRYFFNSAKGTCDSFTYGGCDGNLNNFESLDDCQRSCNPNGCPPYCTAEYCSARSTRRALCTVPSKDDKCGTDCRVTFCHACYYSEDDRSNPDCQACTHNPQTSVKCFRRWAVCTRRANHAAYGNPRKRERIQENFKCYEHPCQ